MEEGTTLQGNMVVSVTTASVDGTITADHIGALPENYGGGSSKIGFGPGGGSGSYSTSSNYPSAGGGHVGKGGVSGNYGAVPVAGGVSYLPVDSKYGSGGGGAGSRTGGSGGGVIQLLQVESLQWVQTP